MQIMNDLFLDMCIIIHYAKYNPELENCRKITNLIKNKKEINFLTCCYILEINLPKWINRQKIVVEELKRKVKDNSYEIGA